MENKTSKYFKYAIGEIVLVVIGILIALQINTWNEQRKERNIEQQLLKNLASDFKESLNEYDKVTLRLTNSYKANATLLQLIKDDKPITESATIDSLINAVMNEFATLQLISGTIDEIINTGALPVIKNTKLRNKLSNWSQINADTNDDLKIASDYLFNELIPSLKSEVLLRNTGIPKRILKNINISKITKSNFKLDYNQTVKTIAFENKIFVNALNLAYCINVNKELETYLKETIALINANLK